MKLITKIRKADHLNKTAIFQSADLDNDATLAMVREMVLSLPGSYKIHSREYGTNLVDAVYEVYGWMPSMFVSEQLLLGMQCLYPDKVYASFTLGLDAVEIKK